MLRSALSPERLVSRFPHPDHGIQTLYDCLESSVVKYSSEPFLGTRQKLKDGSYGPYQWITFNEVSRLGFHHSWVFLGGSNED